jgi:hypothetical protein
VRFDDAGDPGAQSSRPAGFQNGEELRKHN